MPKATSPSRSSTTSSTGPDRLRPAYDALRPPFAETGAPGLPIGLNLGAQLYWQQQRFLAAFARAAAIVVMYPQYWSFRLSGVRASEITSLGCHTDLWAPMQRDFSTMVDRLEMAPAVPAASVAPAMPSVRSRPELPPRTGLRAETPVYCGIHDSNASLLPHHSSAARAPSPSPPPAPGSSAWASAAQRVALDPARDTLINVNAFGDPGPLRPLHGRPAETRCWVKILPAGPQDPRADIDDRPSPSARSISRPPCRAPAHSHTRAGHWTAVPATPGPAPRTAVSYYLALMTATCLDLIGAQEP